MPQAPPSTPKALSTHMPPSFWLDFGVFYLGLMWLSCCWRPAAAFAWFAGAVIAAYAVWAVRLGERNRRAARLLLAAGAVAPTLGVIFPTQQNAAELLMILLMTAAGFVTMQTRIGTRK